MSYDVVVFVIARLKVSTCLVCRYSSSNGFRNRTGQNPVVTVRFSMSLVYLGWCCDYSRTVSVVRLTVTRL